VRKDPSFFLSPIVGFFPAAWSEDILSVARLSAILEIG
jgi:hypothetical protein